MTFALEEKLTRRVSQSVTDEKKTMVSTHSQYITDYAPSTTDASKSPLAMLKKTCETIGLADAPRRTTPVERRDGDKKSESPSDKKKDRSPRATPTTSKAADAALSAQMSALQRQQQLGMLAQMPFAMMPYAMMPYAAMPFGGFPLRAPCPYAMARQPCMNPTCTSCPAAAAEFMSSFAAANPLFASYASMMPSTSTSAAAAAAAFQATLPSTMPTTMPTTLPTASSASPAVATSPAAKKFTCSWVDPTSSMCGKTFVSAEELGAHVKSAHSSSPPSSATESSPDKTSTTPARSHTSASSASARFHPYAKSAAAANAAAVAANAAALLPMTMPTMSAMPGLVTPFNALQAMYAQRLMSSMPLP